MALVDRGIQPGLAAVLVGADEASRIYVGAKHKACSEVGMRSEQVDMPGFITEGELLATIRRLNRDPEIHGIIVQLPLPKHVSELAVQTTIDPRKDVDGLHPLNVGLMVRGEPHRRPVRIVEPAPLRSSSRARSWWRATGSGRGAASPARAGLIRQRDVTVCPSGRDLAGTRVAPTSRSPRRATTAVTPT
jgi:hypothetical protein